jgi:tetratricopeptide repeat protein
MKTGDTQKALEYWQKAIEKGNDSKVLKDKLQQKKYIAG